MREGRAKATVCVLVWWEKRPLISKFITVALYKCIRSVGAVSMRLGMYAFRERIAIGKFVYYVGSRKSG